MAAATLPVAANLREFPGGTIRFDDPPGGCFVEAGGYCLGGFVRGPHGLEAVAYADVPGGDGTPDRGWPAACEILVLPATQPRPAGERRAARFRALLATPFTALADVVVGPVIVLSLAAGFSR